MANWGKILSRGNVQDRRSFAPVAGGLGITGLVLYLLINYLTTGELNVPVDQLENVLVEQQKNADPKQFEGEDSYEVFASTVLGSNNDMWTKIFNEKNRTYTPPTLVLFRASTDSACGLASSRYGPFYCTLDNTIYLDETFFDELTQRFGAEGGDVAEAYVIAHEVSHHAQNELGLTEEVASLISEDPSRSNDLSIRTELQADCFAGLWAYSIKDLNVLSPGEIGEAMDAAAAVGDDRVQENATGRVNPESWTHGSSEQRVSWFNRGYDSGNLASCDTFK